MLALDLGGTQIRAAVIQADGTRLARTAIPTPIADGPDAVVAACLDALHSARSAVPASVEASLWGVGVSAPGPIDRDRGVILEPPNMGPAFHDIPLGDLVAAGAGLPAVVDRDTNVAALGEQAFGAGRGCADFLYLTVSTGIGGGVIAGGRLFPGPDGLAGELGHVPVELEGPTCGCGGRGHLEAVASGTALARDARAAIEADASPFLARRAATGVDVTARDVADGEDAGDPTCIALMARARRAIATACVGFVNVFNPHRIIIGGTIAQTQGDRLLGPIRQAIRDETFRGAAARVEVLPPELGPDVSLAGAHPLVSTRLSVADLLPPRARDQAADPPKPTPIPSA
ncbi:MAG TPA: ROK family protein [Candidatus Saccharimonadales bacterium]|nr:ROK family protein [Candidatus Saccharimonadales bacterium]